MRNKTYLYVPFEENAQVKALGARWDFERKCWYIDDRLDPAPFDRWVNGRGEPEAREQEYSIVSEQAYVASSKSRCWKCGASIEVVCIYCETGSVDGDRYEDFSVSNITAIDGALRRQLERWPFFRFGFSKVTRGHSLANHCPHCRAVQADYYLHCEPGGAFFTLKGAPPGAIDVEPLIGRVCMDGDQGFEP
jgi:hypothetical protein